MPPGVHVVARAHAADPVDPGGLAVEIRGGLAPWDGRNGPAAPARIDPGPGVVGDLE